MIERGEEFYFTLETGNTIRVPGELFRHLDRHIPPELCVSSLIDLPHAAFTNLGCEETSTAKMEMGNCNLSEIHCLR
ncbi:MAG: hypothetical protein P8Z37_16260 [Acidobacteriota bacterium]